MPERASSRTVARIIASMSFMSTAPRPQTQPSSTSAANGSTRQSDACAGTTSRCPWTTSAGRDGSAPSTRVTTLARPGAASTISVESPTSSSRPATYSAALRSPGPLLSPKFEVSNRISSRQRSTTSSCADGADGAAPVSFTGPPRCSGRVTSGHATRRVLRGPAGTSQEHDGAS